MKRWILIPFLLGNLYAADPPSDVVTESVIDDVSGGWVTSIPSHKLGKSYSPNLRNVSIDNNAIEQINGFTALGGTGSLKSGEGIFPYIKEDGRTSFLVTDSSMVLETLDFKTYVFVSSAHNPGVLMRCSQIYNNMWCSNGVDSVFKWDSSVKTILDGTKGNPNVPKGKYMTLYLGRVFMFNLPNDASAIRFSDVKSTNGAIINPDNFLAWPGGNLLYAGQGDGQIGTAGWIEGGRLKFGKERSIYTLFGTNASNFNPVLTNPDVGVASHDSVVMMDNQSNFVGHDGIYRNESRNSDLIKDEAESINKDTVRTVSDLWETEGDFTEKGSFSGLTSTKTSGFLEPAVDIKVIKPSGIFMGNDTSVNLFSDLGFGATSYTARINFGTAVSSSMRIYTSAVNAPIADNCLPGDTGSLWITLRNPVTEQTMKQLVPYPGGSGIVNISSQGPVFDGFVVNQASYVIKIETGIVLSGTGGCGVYTISPFNQWNFYLAPATTGQYISQVTTATTLTAWGSFDSVRNTNGGTADYFLRSSTSVINITTQAWQSVIPGGIIPFSTLNTFFQWASTVASVSSFTSVSNIDNVLISHIEGAGASSRAFGISWKGRYWLSVSTSADTGKTSLLLVRSRITNKNPDAWMPVSGINIRSIAKDGEDFLYAGASTAPVFYRLDYGTNFNGQAIESFYTTPSTYFDSPFKEKSLFEYYLIADKNPGSYFYLGLSKNGGSYASTSISLDGTAGTLSNRVIQNVIGKAKLYNWKFLHNLLDDQFKIHNFGVAYQPTPVRKGNNE